MTLQTELFKALQARCREAFLNCWDGKFDAIAFDWMIDGHDLAAHPDFAIKRRAFETMLHFFNRLMRPIYQHWHQWGTKKCGAFFDKGETKLKASVAGANRAAARNRISKKTTIAATTTTTTPEGGVATPVIKPYPPNIEMNPVTGDLQYKDANVIATTSIATPTTAIITLRDAADLDFSLMRVMYSRKLRLSMWKYFAKHFVPLVKPPPGCLFTFDWNTDSSVSPIEIHGYTDEHGMPKTKQSISKTLHNTWVESDHAIGRWLSVLAEEKSTQRMAVVSTDGDMIIVLWEVLRHLSTIDPTVSRSFSNVRTCSTLGDQSRPMAADDQHKPPTQTGLQLYFMKGVHMIWINKMMEMLANIGVSHDIFALSSCLSGNDYIDKKTITPNLGTTNIWNGLVHLCSMFVEPDDNGIKSSLDALLMDIRSNVGNSKYQPNPSLLQNVVAYLYKHTNRSKNSKSGNVNYEFAYASILEAIVAWMECPIYDGPQLKKNQIKATTSITAAVHVTIGNDQSIVRRSQSKEMEDGCVFYSIPTIYYTKRSKSRSPIKPDRIKTSFIETQLPSSSSVRKQLSMLKPINEQVPSSSSPISTNIHLN